MVLVRVTNRFVIANWNTTISNNKLNELRFQWARDFEFDTANEPGPFVSLSSIKAMVRPARSLVPPFRMSIATKYQTTFRLYKAPISSKRA